MAPKFAKGDRVKAYATRFDKVEKDLEEGEILFSDRWEWDLVSRGGLKGVREKRKKASRIYDSL
jgi:hypothetical protein